MLPALSHVSAHTLTDLSWAVSKLAAANTAATASTYPSSLPTSTTSNSAGQIERTTSAPVIIITPGLVSQAWVSAVVSKSQRKLASKGDPFSLQDTARMLWAAAATSHTPSTGPGLYKELVNSFAGEFSGCDVPFVSSAFGCVIGREGYQLALYRDFAALSDTACMSAKAPCCE